MSRFFASRYATLEPYTPGEQPKDRKFIKLNTNESPFPPSTRAVALASEVANRLMLYPDPDCKELTSVLAGKLGVSEDEIVWTNGSDDVLNFAFMAFCDENRPALFCDVTYGFYSVFAKANGLPYIEIPLKDDFTVDLDAFMEKKGTVFLANPNAPTGLTLSRDQIEALVKSDPDRVVVVDEAYVDFGGESCIPLIHRYENLLVTQTFSKSRSMAGARLGFGIGNKELIGDLNTLRYSTNPYNINSMTMAAGIGTLLDSDYTEDCCAQICRNRAYTTDQLKKLDFVTTDSRANFIFAKHPILSGETLYLALKEKGVLVRHFKKDRISDYCRITVGSREEMEQLIVCIKEILKENL